MELNTRRLAEFNDPLSNPIARGLRVKSLRKMAGLSRLALETKHGISSNTLQSWEKAKAGGLTPKGATRFIQALQKEGVTCSSEWLLFGIGEPAQLLNSRYLIEEQSPSQRPISYSIDQQQNIITKELLTFRSLNHKAIDYLVLDDGMAPYFLPGDYVGGKRRSGEEIQQLLRRICIVHTQSNEVLLRYLLPGSQPGFYKLSCINPGTAVARYTLYEQRLNTAAPVVWHRRRDRVGST